MAYRPLRMILNASAIVEALFDETISQESLIDHLSVIDVQKDVRQFSDELNQLQGTGRGVPAMEVADGPPVPVSLSLIKDQVMFDGMIKLSYCEAR
jgi:hypothetical protein